MRYFEQRDMHVSRGILTSLALLGLLLVIAVLLLRGRAAPIDARAALPPSAAEAPHSISTLDPPEKLEDARTREDVPPPPITPEPGNEPAAASVSGLVLDADTGAAIDRFEIVHSPTGAGGRYVDTLFGYELEEPNPSIPFENTGGRFTLPDLGPEARSLTVVAPGYEIPELQIVELRPDVVRPHVVQDDLVFRIHRAASVHGRVIDPLSGAPVANALIAWIDDGGQARAGPKERFERTDALGRFALDSVPAGPRRLLAGREDLGQAFTRPMELEPGVAAQEIVIELGPSIPR